MDWWVFCKCFMLFDDILKTIRNNKKKKQDSSGNSSFPSHVEPGSLNLVFLYNFFVFPIGKYHYKMTQYNCVNIKSSYSELEKLKSATKNGTTVTLRL